MVLNWDRSDFNEKKCLYREKGVFNRKIVFSTENFVFSKQNMFEWKQTCFMNEKTPFVYQHNLFEMNLMSQYILTSDASFFLQPFNCVVEIRCKFERIASILLLDDSNSPNGDFKCS